MIQFVVDGYFSEKACEAIKKDLEGASIYDFKISYSGKGASCNLIVESDYSGSDTVEDLKSVFYFMALNDLSRYVRGIKNA